MAQVTDYGLAFTEFAGALLVLAFFRAMFIYGRARLHPTPVIAVVRPPATLRSWLRPAKAASAAPSATPPTETVEPQPGPADASTALVPVSDAIVVTREAAVPNISSPPEGDLPLTSVIVGTKSAHVEETAEGDRFLYWSLTRFRREKRATDDET